MTDAQWLSSSNPHEMLTFLEGQRPKGLGALFARLALHKSKVSARKSLLFACACCRRIWPLLGDERSRRAIDVAELYADGLVSKKVYRQAILSAREASLGAARPRVMMGEWMAAAQARAAEAVALTLEADDPADEAATWAKEAIRAWATQTPGTHYVDPFHQGRKHHSKVSPESAWIAEGMAQCDLLRDIVGNLFHPPTLDPAWRSPQAVALGKSIFHDRSFSNLPELAKLLEQAGCKNAEILQHCRDTKEHARGCWALDFVLGRA